MNLLKKKKKNQKPLKPTSFGEIYYAGHEKSSYVLQPFAGNDPMETKGQGQGRSTKSNMQTNRPLLNRLKSCNPSKTNDLLTNSSKLLLRLGAKTF